ncbi:MAG TPA: hypothetical protein VF224_04440, partial [Aestuariivirga sp.]
IFIGCMVMRRPERLKSVQPPKDERQVPSGSRRARLAVLLTLVTVVCLGSALFLSKGTQLLMPGPLTSGHGAIENCSACHTKSGDNKLSWIHGLVAADPLADSKACLSCHKMPDTAFNSHSASAEVLKQSTRRLTKIAAGSTAPQSARAQNIAFPMRDVMAGDIYCATCHQEHQGANFNLNRISNEQCRSCHVLKFDSFDNHHPKFENYPFKRRTRIIFDHAGHFGKHYPEVAKKDPAKRIPATCSTCHNSEKDKRVMAVVPFEQNCSVCHLDQIIGKERVSGPKGIAFLALPGLDLQTLKQKNAPIGEWPDDSEAALTPFMKMMISRNEQGRTLVKAVDSLNLQDLTTANDDQIKAVTNLVWEIKGLFYALIKGKASDVLGDLNIGGGAKLSATLVADLTASLPRDAVTGAQQEWLPNLAAEIANGPGKPPVELSGTSETPEPPAPTPQEPESEPVVEAETAEAEPAGTQGTECTDELPRAKKVAAAEEAASESEDAGAESAESEEPAPAEDQEETAVNGRLSLPSGTSRAIKTLIENSKEKVQPEEAAGETDTADAESDGSRKTPCVDEQPGAKTETQVEKASGETDTTEAKAGGGEETPPEENQPAGKAGDQVDDLLFPTEAELGGSSTGSEEAANTSQPEEAEPAPKADSATDSEEAANTSQPEEAEPAPKADSATLASTPPDPDTAVAVPQAQAAPVIGIESDVDPESWAEYGGWYRQDYAIFYRPIGHKDKFNYSWLLLTGPQAPKGDTSPVAAVFDSLTNKDAQGSCTKCHSVDDIRGNGRVVNFSPASVKSKVGRFTNFIHEPHMGILDNRGCQTCHSLEKGRPYLTNYEQGNPQNLASSFGAVKKELCQTCHTSGKARQDCLTCHKYHVNGVTTPIMNTKIPVQ